MSVSRLYVNFNINLMYETPVVWLLDEVPGRHHMAMSDRAED